MKAMPLDFSKENKSIPLQIIVKIPTSCDTYVSFIGSQLPTSVRDPVTSRVLVLTYLRSGSTLTGDILQQSPKSFYLYEPLKKDKSQIFFNDYACLTSTKNCSDLFNCHLKGHEQRVLGKSTGKQSLAVTRAIPDCKASRSYDICIKKIQKICHESNSIILKTIRVSMDLVRSLLIKFKDIHIVHLLRDPRGIMSSRRRGGFLRKTDIGVSAKWLCEVFRSNIYHSKALQSQFPNRITTVLYEDIAENPFTVSNELYRNLNLEYSETFDEWLFNHTSAGNTSYSYYGTVRSNSKETSQSWRTKLKFHDVKVIENVCKDVIERLGFRNVVDENDLRNIDNSLRIRSFNL
ncbi:carbohydrate sulfotransferase 1-like isoform X3 [Ostrea edulis]|uniref:carbohydrate sulfotransferase 1-like isoform X3 n=1 Tax=Ostrea edulis TaxID=37623 RepID=UPI002094C31F|nr:carbohydrate sulfotransferase 1-like isoform X3 [Ostrea edulis]